MQQPVLFAEAMAALVQRCDVLVEVGPTAVLGPCIAAAAPGLPLRGVARTPATALADAFELLAQLWLAGCNLAWAELLTPGPAGAPFPRKPWDTPAQAQQGKRPAAAPAGPVRPAARKAATPAGGARGGTTTAAPATVPAAAPAAAPAARPAAAPTALPTAAPRTLLVPPPPAEAFAACKRSLELPPLLKQHVIMGRPMMPMAAWMGYALTHAAEQQAAGGLGQLPQRPVVVEGMRVLRLHLLQTDNGMTVTLEQAPCAQRGASIKFVDMRGQALASCDVPPPGALAEAAVQLPGRVQEMAQLQRALEEGRIASVTVEGRLFYKALNELSVLHHKPTFHAVTKLLTGEGNITATLRLPAAAAAPAGGAAAGMLGCALHPVLLDGLMQCGAGTTTIPSSASYSLPVRIARITALPEAITTPAAGGVFKVVGYTAGVGGGMAQGGVLGALLLTTEAGECAHCMGASSE